MPPQINAPLKDIRYELKKRKIITNSNKPRHVGRLIHIPDAEIVSWYTAVGRDLLNYYCCCQNFYKVKAYVNYMIRWSAIHTLAGKHKSSSKKIIGKHTIDLEIKTMGRKFRPEVLKGAAYKTLNQVWARMTKTKFPGIKCAYKNCNNKDIDWHHIMELKRKKDSSGNISVLTKKDKRVTGTEAFKVAYSRKQIPLCEFHHYQIHDNKISLKNLDWNYIEEIS